MFRMAVFGLFLITLALSVYLVKWSIASIPVRGILSISILLLVATANIEIVISEIHRFRFILAATVAVAFIGVVASLSSGAELNPVGRQILEIHVQAFVNIVVGACVVRICGIERSLFALVGRRHFKPLCCSNWGLVPYDA
jgi:hypothetical protein